MELKKLANLSVNFDKVIRSCIEALINHQEKIDLKIDSIENRMKHLANSLALDEILDDHDLKILSDGESKNKLPNIKDDVKDIKEISGKKDSYFLKDNKLSDHYSIIDEISEIIERHNTETIEDPNKNDDYISKLKLHDDKKFDNKDGLSNFSNDKQVKKNENNRNNNFNDNYNYNDKNFIKNINERKDNDNTSTINFNKKDSNNKINQTNDIDKKGNDKNLSNKDLDIKNDKLNINTININNNANKLQLDQNQNNANSKESTKIINKKISDNKTSLIIESNSNNLNENKDDLMKNTNKTNKIIVNNNNTDKDNNNKENSNNNEYSNKKDANIKTNDIEILEENNDINIINTEDKNQKLINEDTNNKNSSIVNEYGLKRKSTNNFIIPLKTQDNINLEDIKDNFLALKSNGEKTTLKVNLLSSNFTDVKVFMKTYKAIVANLDNEVKKISNETIKSEDFNIEKYKEKILKLEENNLNLSLKIEKVLNIINSEAHHDEEAKNIQTLQIMFKNTEKRNKEKFEKLEEKIDIQRSLILKEAKSNINEDIHKLIDPIQTLMDYKLNNMETLVEDLKIKMTEFKDPLEFDKQILKNKDFQTLKFTLDQLKMNFSQYKESMKNTVTLDKGKDNKDNIISDNSQNTGIGEGDNKKELFKMVTQMQKRLIDLERQVLGFIQTSNIEVLNKDVVSLKHLVQDFTKIEDTQELYNKINALYSTVKQNKDDFSTYVSGVKFSEDINLIKKKVEVMNAVMNKMQQDIKEYQKPVVDISHLLETSDFVEFKNIYNDNQTKIYLKLIDIQDHVDKVNSTIDELKNDKIELKTGIDNNLKLINKVSTRLPFDYVTNKEFSSKVKMIDIQIRNLVDSYLKSMEKSEAWILAKNKIHTHNCASCEKVLNKAFDEHTPEVRIDRNNKSSNKLGHGYSKKLKSLDINRISNPELAKSFVNGANNISRNKIDGDEFDSKNKPSLFKDKNIGTMNDLNGNDSMNLTHNGNKDLFSKLANKEIINSSFNEKIESNKNM